MDEYNRIAAWYTKTRNQKNGICELVDFVALLPRDRRLLKQVGMDLTKHFDTESGNYSYFAVKVV